MKKELAAAPTPPAQYCYEAACSGLRYTIPEACGNVAAIHLDGKRWPVAMDGWRDAMSEALDVVAQYAPGFSLLIERMERILDAPTPPAQEDKPMADVGEDYVFLLRKQDNGDRWPAGTKLYTRPDNSELRQAAERVIHCWRRENWTDGMPDLSTCLKWLNDALEKK